MNRSIDRRHRGIRRTLAGERLEDRRLLAVLFEQTVNDAVRAFVPSEAAYDDLGFDWLGAAEPFDDSAWATVSGTPNGIGYDRGNGAYGSVIGFDVEPAMYNRSTTLFARVEFEVVDPSLVGIFKLRLRHDDGFIAWVNGQEVARANVAGIYPTWDATAIGAYEAPLAPVEFDIAGFASALRAGSNILAIRLFNDSVTGDDALLELSFVGESRTGPPLAINDAATTSENQPITINVLANDRRGTDPIETTSVAIATQPQRGTAVANPDGTVTYTPALGHHGPDTFSYTVRDISPIAPETRTLIAANSPARALVPANNNLGTTWRGGNEPFSDGSWRSGTFGVGYDLNVAQTDFTPFIGLDLGASMQNINGTAYVRSTFALNNPQVVETLTLRLRYDDGFAAFLNGVPVASDNAPATLTYNSLAAAEFRPDNLAVEFATFDITAFKSALRSGSNVLAFHVLNGTGASTDLLLQPELTAFLRPLGRVSNAATVSVQVADVDHEPVVHDDSYQVDEGRRLIANAPTGAAPSPQLLVAGNATWKYRDTGVPPANDGGNNSWRSVAYSDATWSSGPAQLGYGDGDEATVVAFGTGANKHITTWFRHRFQVSQLVANNADSLLIELLRDDGAAVYLNGVEIVRSNLPGVRGDTSLTATTKALTGIDLGNESVFNPFTIDLTSGQFRYLLREGDNVLAVEVHQYDAESSDLSFALRATANLRTIPGVLANDVDGDGDVLTASVVTPPVNGTLEFQPNGTFVYVPASGFIGSDQFVYRVEQSVGSQELLATATIVVRHVAPTVAGDNYQIAEDTTLRVAAELGVLANDVDTQGHALSAHLATAPTHGSVMLRPDGSFDYVPAGDYHGLDSFTYRAFDGVQFSGEATVIVTIAAVNDAPLASNDLYLAAQNQSLTATPPMPNYVNAITAASPLAYWRLGERTVDTMAHEMMNAYHGTFGSGVVRGFAGAIADDANTSTEFDGSAGQITVQYRPALNLLSNFTIEAWIRPDVVSGIRRVVANGTAGTGYGFGLFDGGLRFTTYSVKDYNTQPILVPGRWYHVAVVFDSQFDATFYVDGTFFQFITGSAAANSSDNHTFIGRLGTEAFDGRIDEVAIYNRSLSAQEIQSHFLAGIGIAATPETVNLIGRNATWKYRDDLANGVVYPTDAQGDRWTENDYNDAAWPAGPAILGYDAIDAGPLATTLGFGGNANDKYRTALFRRAFTVSGAASVSALKLDLLADDGASVYVNGQEVLRYNLPGVLGDSTLSTNTIAAGNGNEGAYLTFRVDLSATPGLLVDGVNTIAVEVHQSSATSTDLGFDLALAAYVFGPEIAGLLVNDTDVDGDALTAAVIDGPQHGTLHLPADGRFTYTPVTGFRGTDSFTYRIFDGTTWSSPAVATIVVAPPNKAAEDLNADGVIDAGDVAFLLGSFGKPANATAFEGDLNGDGRIGVLDAIRVRNAMVAAPATSAAAAAAAAVVVARSGERNVATVGPAAIRVDALRVDRLARHLSGNVGEIRRLASATDQVLAELGVVGRGRLVRRVR